MAWQWCVARGVEHGAVCCAVLCCGVLKALLPDGGGPEPLRKLQLSQGLPSCLQALTGPARPSGTPSAPAERTLSPYWCCGVVWYGVARSVGHKGLLPLRVPCSTPYGVLAKKPTNIRSVGWTGP